MAADDQPVVIAELAAPRATLILGGIDLPEPPVEVPTTQRAGQTWLPGARVATAHVMGAQEGRITLRGRWHDDVARLVGDGPLVRLRQARGLLARGSLCRMVWGDVIVRRGRVVKVLPRFFRDKDIAYEVVFEVDESLENYGAVPPNEAAVALRKVRNAVDAGRQLLTRASGVAAAGRLIAGRKR